MTSVFLCLCIELLVDNHHRGTENTEVAQS